MTRQHALQFMRIAGYHADTKSFTRLFVENRVSKSASNEAWLAGVSAKKSGMKCTCLDCTPKEI